jgi:hypothetical protein
MASPVTQNTVFIGGAARFKDLIYVIAKDRGLLQDEVEHTRFVAFDNGKFCHNGDKNWSAVAVCIARRPTEKMVAIGENGEVLTFVGGKRTEEKITPPPSVLRGIGVVDGLPVACGMKRQVYRRTGDNAWTVMNAPPPPDGENAGFEAIAGYSGKEMYAVGWKGEIWEWDGSQWLKREGPTNLILTGVCCADDGNVYICGQHGTLIRGRHDAWDTVDLGDFTRDLWDIHWFDGKVYLATVTDLYTYSAAGLAPVDFGPDPPATCYRLTSAEGVLWSVGASDIFSFDGGQWTRVD